MYTIITNLYTLAKKILTFVFFQNNRPKSGQNQTFFIINASFIKW